MLEEYLSKAGKKAKGGMEKAEFVFNEKVLARKHVEYEKGYDVDHGDVADDVERLEAAYEEWRGYVDDEDTTGSRVAADDARDGAYRVAKDIVEDTTYSREGLYIFCQEHEFDTSWAGYFISAAVNAADETDIKLPELQHTADILEGLGYRNRKRLYLEGSDGDNIGEENLGDIYVMDDDPPDTSAWNKGFIYAKHSDGWVYEASGPPMKHLVEELVDGDLHLFQIQYRHEDERNAVRDEWDAEEPGAEDEPELQPVINEEQSGDKGTPAD